MRAILSLFLAATLAACGGGDPEPAYLGELTTVTTGGRADVAAPSLAVSLQGPVIQLSQPALVQVDIELDWQQSVATPSALAFSVNVGGVSSAPVSTGLVTTAATRFTSTHSVQVQLPAGATDLSALGQVVATTAAGAPASALTYFDVTAVWRVTVAP